MTPISQHQQAQRTVASRLPKLIEEYARGTGTLSQDLLTLTLNWLRNLEKRHYHSLQFGTQSNRDRRMDRAMLFFRFCKEERHRDGALLMAMFRWQFASAEVLLLMRHWRIAVAEDRNTILGKLRHTDIEFIKVVLTLKARIERNGKQLTTANLLDEWVKHRESRKGNKSPGQKARANFLARYDKFAASLESRREHEKSWVIYSERSDVSDTRGQHRREDMARRHSRPSLRLRSPAWRPLLTSGRRGRVRVDFGRRGLLYS